MRYIRSFSFVEIALSFFLTVQRRSLYVPPNTNVDVNVCVVQAYHDVWIGLLLATHLRMVMVNTTTYESIKGRRWVENSTHGKPFYVRYPTNCFRFFFRPGGDSGRMAGPYGRVPNQVRTSQPPLLRFEEMCRLSLSYTCVHLFQRC